MSDATRIRVKFLGKAIGPDNVPHWLARFPGGVPRLGECEFTLDRQDRCYDWLVVYDDLPPRAGERRTLWEERLACPRAHTLLITTEPSSIKAYEPAYTAQFGWVLTSQEPWALRHPHRIHCQPGLVWYYGATGHGNAAISERGSYDHIVANVPCAKTKDISTVCSTKAMKHTLHAARNEFVRRLQSVMPHLEVFGHGVRYAADKADTLDPYRYHIAIENHVCPHHWTEKLGDPFLGACLPLYHGCPNYADYFPAESVLPINIHDFDAALETIRGAIRDNEYEQRLPAILESRRLYLDRFALFPQLARLIAERHTPGTAAGNATICSRHLLRRRSPWHALGAGWARLRVGWLNRRHYPRRTG